MTRAERYKRWHDIADAISLAINTATVLWGYSDFHEDPDECYACRLVNQILKQAFTISQTQYKKYMEVNHE